MILRRLLASLLLCFGLLAACATLPDTTPASGPVGGRPVSVGVDSPEAAYYIERYLKGERGWSEIDGRLAALYADADPQSLPGRDELKRLADEFSVDFASIYFAERVALLPANRLLRRTYDAHLARAMADYYQKADRSLLPEAGDYHVIFVPAYNYESHTNTGANLETPRVALRAAGMTPRLIPTDEIGAIESNAALVADYLRRATRPGDRVILVSASKSSPEVALALSALEPETAGRVKAWINIVGTLQGTPLADEVLGDGPLSRYRPYVDDPGMHSMVTPLRREAYKTFRFPDALLVINYIGIPVTSTISKEVKDSWLILRPYGPNDGLNMLADLIAPNSVTLADFGRDHYMVDETLRQRTIALINTTVEWLESCAARPDGHWTELDNGSDCRLAQR
jgi:hypothetical protein